LADRTTPDEDAGVESDPRSLRSAPEESEPRSLRSAPKERVTKGRRRAQTNPPPGSDPAPAPEPKRHSKGENDDRLRGDKPPHY
jgi:hypothetical protein